MARCSALFTILLCEMARAGAVVSFAVEAPANGVAYMPGEVVNVEVMVQLTPGTPSVPGPGGTMTSIRVRFMQFDFSNSSPELDIRPVDQYSLPGGDATPFWDFGGSSACANDSTQCGTNYFVDGNMSDDLVNISYTSLTTSGSQMITLNQFAPKRVAELTVTLPLESCGDYRVDVLNADDTNPDHGAQIGWGFGSTADPTDPTSPLRGNVMTAGHGGIVMAGAPGQQNGLLFTYLDAPCIPEPATLGLLGLGGLLVARRRNRAA